VAPVEQGFLDTLVYLVTQVSAPKVRQDTQVLAHRGILVIAGQGHLVTLVQLAHKVHLVTPEPQAVPVFLVIAA
jgi:hypothetical protein